MMNNLQNAKAEIDPLQQYFNLRDANVELKGRRGSDLVGSDVILVASPPESFGSTRPYHRYLNRELKSRLQRNRERLDRLFPDHRLVAVPARSVHYRKDRQCRPREHPR